jgi:hypothetical protein
MTKHQAQEPLHTPTVRTFACTSVKKRHGRDLEEPSSVPLEPSSNTKDWRSGYRNYELHSRTLYFYTVSRTINDI